MSKIAFLFPGQGSQSVGMGMWLAQTSAEASSLYGRASHMLGWDLLQACREGPEDWLKQTHVAQPALFVSGYAVCMELKARGIVPDAVAGHSIGEYVALAAAGVFSFSDGLALVKERGQLMQEAAQTKPGRMVAILGLSAEQVQTLCQKAQAKGICVPVNFNSPEQVVVAGESAALEEAGRLATAAGAKRVLPLNVAGAFHSPLMKEAAKAMADRLNKVPFQRAAFPVAMNVDGKLHQEPAEIKEQLIGQLDHAVQWVQSIRSVVASGVGIFVESGTGRVLSGLLRRIDKQVQAYATDTAENFQEAVEALAASRKGSI